MRQILISVLLLISPAFPASAQACIQIHGRAVWYRGDGYFAIWHIGTRHEFYPTDASSINLLCKYFDCESGDRQPALFADFEICPSEPFREGAAQGAYVKAVRHPRVVADWPVPKSAREYIQHFYEWYGLIDHSEDAGWNWDCTLWLIHWDLSPALAKLLKEDADAQANCNEIVGLDFDPVVFSQEDADKYEIGAIRQAGEQYHAEVFSVIHGQRSDKPAVIADFVREPDRWILVNFEYPSRHADLLSILKSPRPRCTAPRETATKK